MLKLIYILFNLDFIIYSLLLYKVFFLKKIAFSHFMPVLDYLGLHSLHASTNCLRNLYLRNRLFALTSFASLHSTKNPQIAFPHFMPVLTYSNKII